LKTLPQPLDQYIFSLVGTSANRAIPYAIFLAVSIQPLFYIIIENALAAEGYKIGGNDVYLTRQRRGQGAG